MQGMNAHLAVRTGEKIVAMGSQPKGGEGVDSDRELMPEDARSISQGLWRMVRLAQDAAEQGSPEWVLPERMDSVRYTLPYRAYGMATP